MKTSLPIARAVVCRDATSWDDAAGAYRWACDGASADDVSAVIKIGWQAKNPDGTLIKDANDQFPPLVVLTVAPYVK